MILFPRTTWSTIIFPLVWRKGGTSLWPCHQQKVYMQVGVAETFYSRFPWGQRNWLDANPRANKTLDTLAGEIQHDLGEEEIGDQHQDGRNDHGLRGGAADSLGAAAHAQALEATDRGEDETEYQRLDHALHDVRKFERVDGARPELDSAQAESRTITAPMKKEVSRTIGSEPTPMRSICSNRSVT